MVDAYTYEDEQDDRQQVQDPPKLIARCVAKLKGSSRNSQLRTLVGLLEGIPQDVRALGSDSASAALLEAITDRSLLHSKQKDVRMYAAACFAQILRIYAPETPFSDKQMEAVFDLMLWSVKQVAEYQAPTYEFAVSVLQTISQTKSYFIVLDWGREDVVLDWVRALLQCINAGSSALSGPHALEILVGIVSDEGTGEAVMELLLSHLVPPRSHDNPLACQLAQAVLKACECAIKPALQKYLTTLILSPITSNTDLHQQCYALIYQLYITIPQVLLPVIPHLTSELHAEEGPKRLEACQLLGRLLSLPGNTLVNEYTEVLNSLLRRYSDTQVNIRLAMLDFTPSLLAAAGTEDLQQQVLAAAAQRLQDYDEKVRLAAVKSVCQAARQLLVGPANSAAASSGPGSAHASALLSPMDVFVGSIGSQELTDAAAADLDLAAAADLQGSPAAAAAVAAAPRHLAFVHEALKRVGLRLRDTKLAVRKVAASHLLATYRAVVAAGDAAQVSNCCWLAGRVLLCSKSDKDLQSLLFETTSKDGVMGSKVTPEQAAAAWVRLWLTSSELEREALLMQLNARTRLQVDTLQFLALRRKLSGRPASDDDGANLTLDQASKQLAAQLPQPDRATETISQLLQVRDNHVFAVMQTALAPGASSEAFTKARADALARVGSRSPAAEAVSQLLLWARPSAWLPTPIMSALLELAAQDPNEEEAELVQGAYQLLTAVAKAAPMLSAGLLPQLHHLMVSSDAELQQLGTQMVARCAAQMRKCGSMLAKSAAPEMNKFVQQQLLPSLCSMSRGQLPKSPLSAGVNDEQLVSSPAGSLGFAFGSRSQEGPTQVAPKAAKWAVYGMAACQDSSTSRMELEQVADSLATTLDPTASDTAAKLQALSVVGRLLPDAFSRHVESLLHFVTEDYFNSYIDAAAGAQDMQGAGSGGCRRSVNTSSLLGPSSQGTASLEPSNHAMAAGLLLKCTALKALAAGCVPDSDAHYVPVETLRVVARLAEFLEGLLEPGDEALPLWLADASPELCGQLRLSAATALLRLARRHDARITPSTYSALGLMMQDEVEGVRAAFAGKVFRLTRFFLARPSSHQLSAKYAAMLPLAAADPVQANKDKAARMLRIWVHERRATVQVQLGAAAREAQEGGSTLQDLPEMLLPYGLYSLAHHPDFPMAPEDVDNVDSYTPFQSMLQFMLQPLLVASGSHPAGHMAPVLIKMCRTIKRTVDATEPPCTVQLYSLCDMAADAVEHLCKGMNLQPSGQCFGSIVLPRGLYRALDKAEQAGELSYLPPGYEFILDQELPAALSAPGKQGADQPAAVPGRGAKSKAAAADGGKGRGSKRKTATVVVEQQQQQQHTKPAADMGHTGSASAKRARVGKAEAGTRQPLSGPAGDSSDDGWNSDEDAPPSAQKADQLTRRQQVLRQQRVGQRMTAPLTHTNGVTAEDAQNATQHAGCEDGAEEGGDDSQPHKQQQARGATRHRAQEVDKQQQRQQRSLKQQQLSFAAAAAADASSPAPTRRGRHSVMQDVPATTPTNKAAGSSDEAERGSCDQHQVGPVTSIPASPFAASTGMAEQDQHEAGRQGRNAKRQGRVTEDEQAAAAKRQQWQNTGKGRHTRQQKRVETQDALPAVGVAQEQLLHEQLPAVHGRRAAPGKQKKGAVPAKKSAASERENAGGGVAAARIGTRASRHRSN